jgi:hypothetical protein
LTICINRCSVFVLYFTKVTFLDNLQRISAVNLKTAVKDKYYCASSANAYLLYRSTNGRVSICHYPLTVISRIKYLFCNDIRELIISQNFDNIALFSWFDENESGFLPNLELENKQLVLDFLKRDLSSHSKYSSQRVSVEKILADRNSSLVQSKIERSDVLYLGWSILFTCGAFSTSNPGGPPILVSNTDDIGVVHELAHSYQAPYILYK